MTFTINLHYFGMSSADNITMIPFSVRSNHSNRRSHRRNHYRLLLCASIALVSSSIPSFCIASRSYSRTFNHGRRPSSLISQSTSLLISLRGGNSEQKHQSLSKNNNNEKSPFEYIPVTALNNYGQSTQLRHAMEAASRYGTPIIACLCCNDDVTSNDDDDDDDVDKSNSEQREENSIIICSLQRPRLGVVAPSIPTGASSTNIRRHSSSNSIKVHPSIQGLVKILATRDDVDTTTQHEDDVPMHSLHTAIVSTGIQSDATFLLNQLQRHFSKFWFRYNTLPTNTQAVVKMIQEVLLDCMGYDWSEEMGSDRISGGIGSAAPSYDDNEDEGNGSSAAGRPLGLSSLLLSLENGGDGVSSLSSASHRPMITLIEANGSSEQYVARAMGLGAQKANELLSQKWKRGMNCGEAKAMMQEILQEVAIERGWMSLEDDKYCSSCSSNLHVGLTVVCETVTKQGVDIEFSPLRQVER